jgi:hypothetical protein
MCTCFCSQTEKDWKSDVCNTPDDTSGDTETSETLSPKKNYFFFRGRGGRGRGNFRQQYAIARAQMKRKEERQRQTLNVSVDGGSDKKSTRKSTSRIIQEDDLEFFQHIRGATYRYLFLIEYCYIYSKLFFFHLLNICSMELKKWTFPLKSHNDIVKSLNSISSPKVRVKHIPIEVLTLLEPSTFGKKVTKSKSKSAKTKGLDLTITPSLNEKIADDTVDLSKLPPKFLSQLRPFQLDSVSFALKRNARIMIADEMGLGKFSFC